MAVAVADFFFEIETRKGSWGASSVRGPVRIILRQQETNVGAKLKNV